VARFPEMEKGEEEAEGFAGHKLTVGPTCKGGPAKRPLNANEREKDKDKHLKTKTDWFGKDQSVKRV